MVDNALIKTVLLQLVVALSLSACASSGEPTAEADVDVSDLDFRGNDCILIRTIRDYTPLDRQHLVIHGPARRGYFVTLVRPAFEMRGSIGFRVESRDDQLCPYGGDGLVFDSIGSDVIQVRSISRLTADQEELLLIRYGIGPGSESVTPVQPGPKEVTGAEVEELG